jgi:hypothetical protein
VEQRATVDYFFPPRPSHRQGGGKGDGDVPACGGPPNAPNWRTQGWWQEQGGE